jgi:hypothetical protein
MLERMISITNDGEQALAIFIRDNDIDGLSRQFRQNIVILCLRQCTRFLNEAHLRTSSERQSALQR